MTQKQRDYATNFMALTAALFVAVVIWGAYAAGQGFTCNTETVVVKPGDSLWTIVEEHCEGNVRSAVNRIDVSTFTLQPGQSIVLP